MNLNHLAIFQAVAEESSMSRGAERLCISQPAVSKQIKDLEAALGVTLFDRLPRGLRLTEAGEVQKLRENALDVGLTEGFAEDADLEAEVFGEDELVAVVPPGHPLLQEDEVPAARFCAEPFLMREPGSGTREVGERALARQGIQVQPAMSLGSTEAIKRGVAAGLGVAVISFLALETEGSAGRLCPLALSDLTITRPLHLVRLHGKSEGPAVQAFLTLLRHGGEKRRSRKIKQTERTPDS